MNNPKRFLPWTGLAVIAACALSTSPAGAGVVTYTDQTAWQNAVNALNPTPTTKQETFNGPDTGPISGVSNGLGNGPYSFGGGDFTITLNNIGGPPDKSGDPGAGGSQSGVLNNKFHMLLTHDSADFELFPGFFIDGQGAESIVFTFTQSVLAFGGTWSNGTQSTGVKNEDGINIIVNGVTKLLDPTNGSGFFGIVDSAGISSFRLEPDSLSQTSIVQEADLDNFLYALPGAQPPTATPEPGTLVLFGIGAVGMGFATRRRRVEG